MTILWLDTETFSPIPINNGTYAYAEPVEIMLITYAIDDGPVECIDLTAYPEYPAALLTADKVVIHNSGFDRTVMRHGIGVDVPVERIHDTMIQALAHGLPGGLGSLCDILGVDTDKAKDKKGKQLINLFCKPRPKNMKLRRATSETHPEEWQEFIGYAKLDVEAMRAVYYKLPTWNYRGGELALWNLDTRINDRGFAVDTELARRAIEAVNTAQTGLAARTSAITSGAVRSTNQRDVFLSYILREHGYELSNLQGATLERLLNDSNLPMGLRELLSIRLQVSTTSTSKYKKLLAAVSSDGRLRGTLQFCGASRTGRWSGRTFQPQNLPSKNLPPQEEIEFGIEAIMAGCADLVIPDVMKMTSAAIRSCIVAPEGKKLVVSDLSNIEGRFACWIAGEEWKLQAFRDFDHGTGHDLYKLAYAKSFNRDPVTVTKPQRQIGKVQELALGYEGGVGAFLTFAAVYNIDLDAMVAEVWEELPENLKAEARSYKGWRFKEGMGSYGLTEQTFIGCDVLKRMWREAHPAISSYWKQLESAARQAIEVPGRTIQCGKLRLRRDGAWLRIVLPSGRAICYASPRIVKGKVTYMGVNQFSRKWTRISTYGGKLFENVCQAGSRDIMAANMPEIEKREFNIVLSVHDELITEAKDHDYWSAQWLSNLLSTNPEWAEGLPLAAGGFESYRYRKD